MGRRLKQWTWSQVRELLDCKGCNLTGSIPFGRIHTDSRSIETGDVFLALRGEHFDGHHYVQKAVESGASGLILAADHQFDHGDIKIPCLRVSDTLEAYGDLAQARRAEWGGPVLAIGGSAGKTTTRRLVAASLEQRFQTLQPLQNYNNLVGVPHTLMRLTEKHETAVLELGMNQPGELSRLARLACPSAVLLTGIGHAHVGMFKSHAELISAKLDLFRSCSPGTPLVANRQCPNTWPEMETFTDHPVTWFCGEDPDGSFPGADVTIQDVEKLDPVGYRFSLMAANQVRKHLELRLFGRHQLDNVAAAAALLLAGGFDPFLVCEALTGFRSERYRGDVIQAGDWTFILDCYNAAPSGMKRAIQSLHDLGPGGRLVMVLADMLELGDHAGPAHDSLLPEVIGVRPDLFFGLGENCTQMAGQLEREGMSAQGFGSNREALATALASNLKPGDRVFFKGSHGFALEKIAQEIAPDASIFTDVS
jgi:UDP-N-acetylmuramoyl-tripeptide--D-alanyl-D-alanine ligase